MSAALNAESLARLFAAAVTVVSAHGAVSRGQPAHIDTDPGHAKPNPEAQCAGQPLLLAVGAGFSSCFFLACRLAGRERRAGWVQIGLVILLVSFSFASHLLYLPAGICCLASLMICRNDLLLPRRSTARRHAD